MDTVGSSSSSSSNSSAGGSGGGDQATTKKRRKSEVIPTAHVRKLVGEKRRREQENVFIEELADLISVNLYELGNTSPRSDKCAILQETVNIIRRIEKQDQDEEQREGEPDEGVQQGRVSSTRAQALDNKVLAKCLLEALDGFLFILGADGTLEYVSENVTAYLHRSPEELAGQPLMSLVYSEDQSDFAAAILQTNADSGSDPRDRSLTCRLLVQSLAESAPAQYETMQISVVVQPCAEEEPGQEQQQEKAKARSLVGVARRVANVERNSVLQFVTKLDLNGKILAVDMTGCSSLNYKKMKGRILQDLCHPQDVSVYASHFQEALQSGSSTSTTYRLGLETSEYLTVQTKFKRFPYSPPKSDFIMATHTILPERETTNSRNPVLGSVGEQDTAAAAPPTGTSGAELGSFVLSSSDLALSDFNLDLFPSSTWPTDPTGDEEASKLHPVPQNPAPCKVEPPASGVEEQPQPSLHTSSVRLSFVDDLPVFSPVKDHTPGSPLYEESFKSGLKAPTPSPGASDSKLRDLLLQSCSSASTSSQDDEFMMKILLESPAPNAQSPRHASLPGAGGNDMLLSLLNQKNEDQHLVKRDEQLLKSLGFPLPARKMASPTKKRQASEPPFHVQSQLQEFPPKEGSDPFIGTSELCKKNKMLASLLAKEPMQPTLPVNSVLLNPSGLPQEKLPKDLKQKILQGPAKNWTGGNVRTSPMVAQQQRFYALQKQDSGSYLNLMTTAPSQGRNCARIVEQAHLQPPLGSRTYCAPVLVEKVPEILPQDNLLSDILDQIIEMDPSYDANSAIMVPIDDDLNALIDQLTSPSPAGSVPPPLVPITQAQYTAVAAPYEDTETIDAIERSLMSFETPAAAPSPPEFSFVYQHKAAAPMQQFGTSGIAYDAPSQSFSLLPPAESTPFAPWAPKQQPKRPSGMSWQALSDPSTLQQGSSAPPSMNCGGKPRSLATATRRTPKGSKAPKERTSRTAGGFCVQQQQQPPLGLPPVAVPQYGERPYQFHHGPPGFSQSMKSSYSAKFVSFEQQPPALNPQQQPPAPRSAFSLSLDSGRDSKTALTCTNEMLYTAVSSGSFIQPEFARSEKPPPTSRPLDPSCMMGYGITTSSQMRDNFALRESYSVPPLVAAGDPLDHDDLEALRLSLEKSQPDREPKNNWDRSMMENTFHSHSQTPAEAKDTSGNASRPGEPKMSLLQKLLSE